MLFRKVSPCGVARRLVWHATRVRVAALVLVALLCYLHGPLPQWGSGKGSRRLVCGNTSHEDPQSVPSSSVELGLGTASLSGAFIAHPHAWAATEPPQPGDKVCLASFATVNRISWLPWLMHSWTGPISVAMYTPGLDYSIMRVVLRYMRSCYVSYSRVSIHALYPKDDRPVIVSRSVDVSSLNCTDPEGAVKEIIGNFRWRKNNTFMKLPQNHLRNLARQSCDTNYKLVVDIDMVPSPLLYERLNLFLQMNAKCKKCAFIIPVYEINSSEKILPVTKLSLLQLVSEHRAQQYHIQVFDKNQGNSKLKRWEMAPLDTKDEAMFWSLSEGTFENTSESLILETYKQMPYRELYGIPTYEEYWEPILVLPYDAPSFDERFVGFGFCRNSQVYELHQRGYSFRMLDEPFLSHLGFQNTKNYPTYRIREIKENTIRYEAFKRELQARYAVTPPRQGTAANIAAHQGRRMHVLTHIRRGK